MKEFCPFLLWVCNDYQPIKVTKWLGWADQMVYGTPDSGLATPYQLSPCSYSAAHLQLDTQLPLTFKTTQNNSCLWNGFKATHKKFSFHSWCRKTKLNAEFEIWQIHSFIPHSSLPFLSLTNIWPKFVVSMLYKLEDVPWLVTSRFKAKLWPAGPGWTGCDEDQEFGGKWPWWLGNGSQEWGG